MYNCLQPNLEVVDTKDIHGSSSDRLIFAQSIDEDEDPDDNLEWTLEDKRRSVEALLMADPPDLTEEAFPPVRLFCKWLQLPKCCYCHVIVDWTAGRMKFTWWKKSSWHGLVPDCLISVHSLPHHACSDFPHCFWYRHRQSITIKKDSRQSFPIFLISIIPILTCECHIGNSCILCLGEAHKLLVSDDLWVSWQ